MGLGCKYRRRSINIEITQSRPFRRPAEPLELCSVGWPLRTEAQNVLIGGVKIASAGRVYLVEADRVDARQ